MPTLKPKRITNSIKWYRQNKTLVAAALPRQIGGITYGPRYLESLEYKIEQWEADALPLFLAGAYILNVLVRFRDALDPVPAIAVEVTLPEPEPVKPEPPPPPISVEPANNLYDLF